jgi:hypothetical protein
MSTVTLTDKNQSVTHAVLKSDTVAADIGATYARA